MLRRWRRNWVKTLVVGTAVLLALHGVRSQLALAQKTAAAGKPPAGAKVDDNAPVARVNGNPIRVSDIRIALIAALRGRQVDPQSMTLLQAEMLAQLIDRQLVEKALADRMVKPTSVAVDSAVEKLKRQTSGQGTFADALKQQGVREADLRQQLAWQLTWSAYAEERMTDEVLEEYFRQNRQQLDGTELRASHILFRPLRVGDDEQTDALLKKANDLREKIESGQISFEAAARKYSDGPSKAQGGDVGYFPRYGVMEEAFSRAAFALKKGTVSEPITTTFGVHLLLVTGEKPGEKQWIDVREKLQAPVATQIFNDLAAEERKTSKIEFSDIIPHFKPGTRELVQGKSSSAKPESAKDDKPAKKSAGK